MREDRQAAPGTAPDVSAASGGLRPLAAKASLRRRLRSRGRAPGPAVVSGALLTLLLTVLFLVAVRGFLTADRIEGELARLQGAFFDVVAIDRALSRVTRGGLQSRDPAALGKHEQLQEQLTRVITEIHLLDAPTDADGMVAQIERSSRNLRQVEREALRLAQEGRLEAARAVFPSQAYQAEREQLRYDLEYLSDVAASHAQAVRKSTEARLSWLALLVGFGTLAVFLAWWRVFRCLRRYVGERDEAEAELRTSERRYRLTVDSITDYGMATLDAAGNILTWSPGAELATGYSAAEVVGKPFTITHGADGAPSADAELELGNAARSGAIYHDGWRVRSDGTRYWSREIIEPITGDDGELLGYALLIKDLSLQKSGEAREKQLIQEREQRLAAVAAQGRIRRMLESITDAFVAVDDDCRFTYLNRRAEQIFGRKAEDLLGKRLTDEFPQLVRSGIAEPIQRALAERRYREFEDYYAPLKAWFEVRAYPAADGLSIYFHDITARKHTEEALRHSEERYALVSQVTHEALWEADFETGLLEWNSNFAEVFGGAAATFDEWEQRIHPEDRDEVLASFHGAVEQRRERWSAEYRFQRVDGRYCNVLDRAVLEFADGVPLRGVGAMADITVLKQTEADLIQALHRAERAGRAKSEMLSRASHELRTPMNAILGFAQLLEKDLEEAEDRESVQMILQAGQSLLSLIDRLLAISSADSGELALTLEPLNVEELVAEVVSSVRGVAERSQVRLAAEIPAGCGCGVVADAQRLKQVLSELLLNAISYNRGGGSVEVDCRIPDSGDLRIEVSDTGPGIGAEELESLFEPFIRRAPGGSVTGHGLGLPVCKALIEAMNGRMGVESVRGEGSTFWIELPLSAAATHPPEEADRARSGIVGGHRAVPRILYIEDTPANTRLVERMLKRSPLDLELICAETGQAGLELARSHAPDLILLDLNLPDVSGEEVLSTLLLDASTAAIPVVMISGDALPDNVQRLRSLGLAQYLTKPFTMQSLLDVVHSVLDPEEASGRKATS